MRQIVIKMKRWKVLAWEDGSVIIEGEIERIEDILYIIQEYQRAFGGIKLKVDASEWRGMEGRNPP